MRRDIRMLYHSYLSPYARLPDHPSRADLQAVTFLALLVLKN